MIDSEETTEVKNIGEQSEKDPAGTATAQSAPAFGLVGIAVKAVAVTLSIVMLLLAILTVAMPLSAMRVFNNLGMSERALESGESYISSHIRGADDTDELGNYVTLGASDKYVTADFIEALDTCVNLSDKLMRSSATRGDEKSAKHFATKLERYTRMYASLYGVSNLNAAKDAANIAAVPFASMRPYVYSYAHTVVELNYRARVYLDQTDRMLYNGSNGKNIDMLGYRANTFGNKFQADNPDTLLLHIKLFADYCGALDEYLSVCFERIGVGNGLTYGEGEFTNGGQYQNVRLINTGYEFSLFITPETGFSAVYNQLKNFSDYTQPIVDIVANTAERKLERLYILGELASFAKKMWDMSIIINYNSDMFGASKSSIAEEYRAHTCENYFWATNNSGTRQVISEIYDAYKADYVNFVRGESQKAN